MLFGTGTGPLREGVLVLVVGIGIGIFHLAADHVVQMVHSMI